MANVNQALEQIRNNQMFLLASYLDNAAVWNWLMTRENRHHLKEVADISNSLLVPLKTKGKIRRIVGKEKLVTTVSASTFNNLPDELEKEFVEALIGKDAAEAFFKSVYPSYSVEKKGSAKPLPIDYERLGRLLESNPGLCLVIERLADNETLKELNARLPKDMVPSELITQNNNTVLPQFKSDEPSLPEQFQAFSSNATGNLPVQRGIRRSPAIRPSISSSILPTISDDNLQEFPFDFSKPSSSTTVYTPIEAMNYQVSNVELSKKKFTLPKKPYFSFMSSSSSSVSSPMFITRLRAAKYSAYGIVALDQVLEHNNLLNAVNQILANSPMLDQEVRDDFGRILTEMTKALDEFNQEIPNDRRGLLLLNLLAAFKNEVIRADDFSVKLAEYKEELGIKAPDIKSPKNL